MQEETKRKRLSAAPHVGQVIRPGHLGSARCKCAATGVNSMDSRPGTAPLESCCLAWRSCICQRSSRVGLPPLLPARWSLCPHPPGQTLPAIPSAGCRQTCTSALAKLAVGQVSRLLRPLSRWASFHAGTRPNFLISLSASSTLTETARFVQKKRPQGTRINVLVYRCNRSVALCGNYSCGGVSCDLNWLLCERTRPSGSACQQGW